MAFIDQEANEKAEETGDWSYLAECYTEDAEYRWTLGPGEEFVARGRQQIAEWAVGEEMAGFEGWSYPYQQVLIDEKKGEVVGFWKQVSPYTRPDGSTIEVAGIGGSWFRYGGDYKWGWQRDFFDLLSVFDAFAEIEEHHQLNDTVKDKLRKVARGKLLNGHERLRPKAGLGGMLKRGRAIAKMFL